MRTVPILAATGALALTAVLVPAASASAAKPDIACLKAGLSTLRGAGLLQEVAKNGLSVSVAVNELGVTAREGTDVSALPDPLPLSVVLADHRAGADSLLIYPWCS
jgi:hypothetical protein